MHKPRKYTSVNILKYNQIPTSEIHKNIIRCNFLIRLIFQGLSSLLFML